MNSTRRRAGLGALAVAACFSLLGSPAQAVGPAPNDADQDAVSVSDDTGLLTIDVPMAWSDVSTAPAVGPDGTSVPEIVASPNQAAFYDTYTTPGVIYSARAYDGSSATAVTALYDFTGICTDAGVTSYSDGYFRGSMQTWTDCDGTASRVVTVFASPLDRSFSAAVLVQLPTPADDAALDTILNSFYVLSPTSTEVVDDNNLIVTSVPVGWTDIATAPEASSSGAASPTIVAATDLTQFGNVPGVRFSVTAYTTDPGTLIQPAVVGPDVFTSCTPGAAGPYDDGYFTGLRQDFTACGNGLRATVVAANANDRVDMTAVVIVVSDPADDAAVNIVLDSFNFVSGTEQAPPVTSAPAPAPTVPAPTAPAPTVPAPTAPAPTVPAPTAPTSVPAPSTAVAGLTTTALVDDSGLLTLSVPSTWTYVDTAEHGIGADPTVVYRGIVAGENETYLDSYGVSGVSFKAFPLDRDLNGLLSHNAPACTPGRITPFDNGYFVGIRQDFTNCGGSDHAVMVAANPPDADFTGFVALYVRPGEEALIDVVLGSLGATDVVPTYRLTDSTGLLTVRVPAWWSDRGTEPTVDEASGAQIPEIFASTPGTGPDDNELYYDAFSYVAPEDMQAANDRSDRCTDGGVTPYDDGVFVGVQRTWTVCDGDPDSQLVQIFAAPADRSFVAAVAIWMFKPEPGVVELILGSFDIAPEPVAPAESVPS